MNSIVNRSDWLLCVALLTACGPAFSGEERVGEDAGAPNDAAGAAGLPLADGGGGSSAAGAGTVGSGGSVTPSGGAPQAGAAAGGAEAMPPCDGAVDVHGGYLAVGADRCLRTEETFDTLTCTNWGKTIIRINGMQAACNAQGNFPPPIDGYNYIELAATGSAAGQLRWLTLAPVVPCKSPVTIPSTMSSVKLGMDAMCIRTSGVFNAVSDVAMTDRTIRINGVTVPHNTQVGFPPSTDGYNYIEISAGSDPNALFSWSFMKIAEG